MACTIAGAVFGFATGCVIAKLFSKRNEHCSFANMGPHEKTFYELIIVCSSTLVGAGIGFGIGSVILFNLYRNYQVQN